MKIKKYLVIGGILLSMPFYGSVAAASANISKSYNSSSPIPNGSIVALDPSKSEYVVPANITNDSRLVGVALQSSQSLLAVNPNPNGVQVAINGTVNTLASTVDGSIKVGQEISASPFNGIGMLAPPGVHYIGIAQSVLTDNSPNLVSEKVKDKSGNYQTIKIGYVKLDIVIGSNNSSSAGGNTANFLQRLIKSLTGKTISTVRIILSIVVALISLASLITLIYASIYGSVISIGRNPLAKSAVFRTLISVMFMAIITVAIACVTIYYLLK